MWSVGEINLTKVKGKEATHRTNTSMSERVQNKVGKVGKLGKVRKVVEICTYLGRAGKV